MAATEDKVVLEVDAFDAAQSVNDLKENIRQLKAVLGDTKIGTEEYKKALTDLQKNQNALKDAMYATTSSLEDVKASATGTGKSYNSLVHEMANLKTQLRSTDVSTKEGAEKFNELARQINSVNDQLKEMDAQQGNFQRNVGNYKSHWEGMAKSTDALDKGLKATTTGLGGVKGGFEAIAASPAIGSFAIILSVVIKLVEALMKNENAMAGIKKALNALQPVVDFFAGVVDKLGESLGNIIARVAEAVGTSGIFDKVGKALMGVGNAIAQYVLAPFKGVIAAIKVFKEQGVSGIGDAAKAFGEEMKHGFSFASNYENGKEAAEGLAAGLKSRVEVKKPEILSTANELGKEAAEEMAKGLNSVEFDKAFKEASTANMKAFADNLKKQTERQKEIDDITRAEMESVTADIEDFYAEQERLREEDLRSAEMAAMAKIDTMFTVADATASILSSIADMYEADAENNEKSAKKAKAIRIASATIDTISGAIGAYMQCVASIPAPAGIIMGAVQAAAVTAAGIAQIARIRSTEISSDGASASSPSTSTMAASVTAPNVSSGVTQTSVLRTATDEATINQLTKEQRVYILQSDIEASTKASQVRVAEATF